MYLMPEMHFCLYKIVDQWVQTDRRSIDGKCTACEEYLKHNYISKVRLLNRLLRIEKKIEIHYNLISLKSIDLNLQSELFHI